MQSRPPLAKPFLALPLLGIACLLALAAYGVFGLPPTPAAATMLQQTATATPAEEPQATSPLTATDNLTGTEMMTGASAMTATGMMTDTAMVTASLATTMAMAELQNITGTVVGMANFTETVEGLQISVVISNFTEATPGEHGIHFHQVGRCEPDFAVAGEHFNPTMASHGLDNPNGPHAGDLPNIIIDEEGNAIYDAVSSLLTLGTGENALLAADGSTLLIHANADDQISNPSGRSGARIACGVVTAMEVPAQPAPTPPPPITGNNVEPERRSATPARIAQLQTTEGFTITAFAQDLGNVRMMAQAEDGTIYVTRRGQGDVLALRDEDGDGRADGEPITAAAGLTAVHGIVIQGDQIYLAQPNTVTVGTLVGDGTIADLQPDVTGMPDAGQHGNRTMAFGPDGLLYVSVGSLCNACTNLDPETATLLQVQPTGAYTIFAEGLRNTVGWGWHPATGELWGMDHGSDWRGDDQPPEELNRIEISNNYGWPYCYANRQVDPYLSGSPPSMTKAEFCAQTVGPVLTYQAHSAPIGMVFYTGDQFPEEYRNDAFVAMRGSWNRTEPVGYKVVHVDFDESGQPVAINDFVTGWLLEEEVAHFGRLAGLLVLQDGSLLLSEDTNGVIYRIAYTGE
jgi:glucose/arabinose dehydrogenase